MTLSISPEDKKGIHAFMVYDGWKYFLEVELPWVMIDFCGEHDILWTKPNKTQSV